MDLHDILHSFPARTKLVVIAAELPDGSGELRVLADAPAPAEGRKGGGGPGDTPPDSRDEPLYADAGGAAATPIERVQRLTLQRGNVWLKPREWAQFTGLSARELRRAIDAAALPAEAKEDGRDHGAKVVAADALLAYLATVAAVERGQMRAPDWWGAVRGRRVTAA